MNVLVCGASGCVGQAVCDALAWRGHRVVRGLRDTTRFDGPTLHVDFMEDVASDAWAAALRGARIDAVVNAVGILIESPSATFERIHESGPLALFDGARIAGATRLVQVSALGADATAASPYLRTKGAADAALLALDGVDAAVVRPSLVVSPVSQSTRLFATLASMPVVALPGGGRQLLQPIHVLELAEAIVALVERTGASRGVYELGGGAVLMYRDMLAAHRDARGLGPAIRVPVPMALLAVAARVAEHLPQRVFSRDTVALLARGNVAGRDATSTLLGRPASTLAEGLRATPAAPWVDTTVTLAPVVEWLLRGAIAFLWLYTSAISAAMPRDSGVLGLLERCGFTGAGALWALAATCLLNAALGVLTLARPGVVLYAVQAVAVVGYTATAAAFMPQLTIDHCGPLAKNVPLLAAVVTLWLAEAARPARVRAPAVVTPVTARLRRAGPLPAQPSATLHRPA